MSVKWFFKAIKRKKKKRKIDECSRWAPRWFVENIILSSKPDALVQWFVDSKSYHDLGHFRRQIKEFAVGKF